MVDVHKSHGAIKEYFERRKDRLEKQKVIAKESQDAYLDEKRKQAVEVSIAKAKIEAEADVEDYRKKIEYARKHGTFLERIGKGAVELGARMNKSIMRSVEGRKSKGRRS